MKQARVRRETLSPWRLLTLLVVLGASSVTSAQEELPAAGDTTASVSPAREQTYETGRGVGMAGGRASAVGTSAMAYNPANLPLAPIYHIETMFGYVPGQNTFMYGGAIADGVSSKLAMGLGFYAYHGNEERDRSGYDLRVALGYALTERIGVGLSGRYVKLLSDVENENGERIGPSIRAFTLDAAIRVTAFEGLQIAALGYNLIRTHSPIAPLLVGGSISYSYKQVFSLSVDALADLTTFDSAEAVLGVGAEYLAGGSVPIRLGYRREFGRPYHQLTAALGYVDAKFGADLALRQDIGGDQTRDTQLLLSLRYHVQ